MFLPQLGGGRAIRLGVRLMREQVDLRVLAHRRKQDFEAKVRAIAANVDQSPSAERCPRKTVVPIRPPIITYEAPWRKVLREVAEKHGVLRRILLSPDKSIVAVRARWELFYRLSTECHLSLGEIGRRIGRDHATVLYGIRKFKQEMERASQEDTARQPLLD